MNDNPLLRIGLEEMLESPVRPYLRTSEERIALEARDNRLAQLLNTGKIELTKMIDKAQNAYKYILEFESWRCKREFPDGRICNTVNGVYSNNKTIRKTCLKCAQYRTNPLTLRQELEREVLVQEIMKMHGIGRADATELYESGRGLLDEEVQ